jgi:hypothetical protein
MFFLKFFICICVKYIFLLPISSFIVGNKDFNFIDFFISIPMLFIYFIGYILLEYVIFSLPYFQLLYKMKINRNILFLFNLFILQCLTFIYMHFVNIKMDFSYIMIISINILSIILIFYNELILVFQQKK